MFPVRRKPQFRQKRSSDGIVEWQFEQTVSVTCDIADAPNFGFLSEEYTDRFYTPNNVFRLHWAGCDRLPAIKGQ
jgi:hypothetical protein